MTAEEEASHHSPDGNTRSFTGDHPRIARTIRLKMANYRGLEDTEEGILHKAALLGWLRGHQPAGYNV